MTVSYGAVPTITPAEAAAALAAGRDDFVLLDIREPDEWAIVRIEGARFVPMGELPERRAELDPGAEIAVLCHSGRRSHAVTAWLQQQGWTRACNVVGGIDRWATTVDPGLPRY